MKNKIFVLGLVGVMLTVAIVYLFNRHSVQEVVPMDYKSIPYTIDGEEVVLGGDLQFFGNELTTDLNADGRMDVVFLATRQPGGSGTFYYAFAALKTDEGYIGSDGYFLGDRIAPQTTHMSQNPRHVSVVVVNYADRLANEPMTAQPSMGKSAYLKIDEHNRWGVVVSDFEGESR